MKSTLDTDAILFQILKNSAVVVNAITGGVYNGDRPDSSVLEDIAINTINLTQDVLPQKGVSNVNIHVPDINVQIGGVQQKKADKAKLKALADIVLQVLRAASYAGLSFVVVNQTTVKEEEISQHYVNLRIEWNIH